MAKTDKKDDLTAIFYKKPVGLDKEKHKKYHFAPLQKDSFNFASNARAVFLTAIEFNDACKEYPIVFVKNKDSYSAMAALSLDGKTNVFVKNGKWDARYLPAFVRRYPFIPGIIDKDKTIEQSGKFSLLIDEDYSGFAEDAEGARLFDDDGQQTKDLEQITDYLRNYHTEHLKTQNFINKLVELDLLSNKTLNIGRKGDKEDEMKKVGGIYVVDEEKLKKLDKDKVYEMFLSGELFLIHAHLSSIRNFSNLMEYAS